MNISEVLHIFLNCSSSGRGLLLYLFIKGVIKLNYVIMKE